MMEGGTFISKRITRAEMIAFTDLGPEAISRLKVKDFPVVVINDIYGGALYEEGLKRFAR